jgi:hypothetical protein
VYLTIDLTNLKVNENHKLITYDIKDLYVNIPKEERLTITKSRLLKSNDTQTNATNNHTNETTSFTELFHISKQGISTRKRCLHGITNLEYNSQNIPTIL